MEIKSAEYYLNRMSSHSELDKEASLLGIAGASAFAHLAPNIAMKAVKSTEAGRKVLTSLFSKGIEHGLEGKKLHPNVQRAFDYGAGPETLADYHVGKKIGSSLKGKGVTVENHREFLQKIQDKVKGKTLGNAREIPVVGSLIRHVEGNHNAKFKSMLDKLPTVAEDHKASTLDNVIGAGTAGVAIAAQPHIATQLLVNGARKRLVHSEMGKKFLKKQFERGVDGGKMSKAKEMAYDLGVSPGALDSYRVGKLANKGLVGASKGIDHLRSLAN